MNPIPALTKALHLITLLLLSGFFLISCSHPREAFLKKSLEEATQDDIKAQLGDPLRTKTSLLNGDTIWIYRYVMTEKEMDPTGIKTFSGGINEVANAAASLIGKGNQDKQKDKPHCFHYILTFDKHNILKNWKREDCLQTPL